MVEKNVAKNFQKTLDSFLESSVLRLIPYSVSPNNFTSLRFILLPIILYLLWVEEYGIGIVFFSIAAFSDLIDGSLARTRNQVTKWGIFFDPLADKLLIGLTTLILLLRLELVFLAWIMIFVDFVIGVRATYRKYVLGLLVKAHVTGKIKFMLQAFGIGGMLLYALTDLTVFFTLGIWLLYGAVFFGSVSLLVYYSA